MFGKRCFTSEKCLNHPKSYALSIQHPPRVLDFQKCHISPTTANKFKIEKLRAKTTHLVPFINNSLCGSRDLWWHGHLDLRKYSQGGHYWNLNISTVDRDINVLLSQDENLGYWWSTGFNCKSSSGSIFEWYFFH